MNTGRIILLALKARAHPIWTGRPRGRRYATRADTSQTRTITKALRSLRRAARREGPLVAERRLRALEKRQRRQARNRLDPTLNWKASAWSHRGVA